MRTICEVHDYTKEDIEKCTGCGNDLDIVSHAYGPRSTPYPGDVSICYYCGTISIFDDNIKRRGPTKEEVEKVNALLRKNPFVSDVLKKRKSSAH